MLLRAQSVALDQGRVVEPVLGRGGSTEEALLGGSLFRVTQRGHDREGGADAAFTRERSLGFNLRTRKRVLAPFGAALRAAEARLLALQL